MRDWGGSRRSQRTEDWGVVDSIRVVIAEDKPGGGYVGVGKTR